MTQTLKLTDRMRKALTQAAYDQQGLFLGVNVGTVEALISRGLADRHSAHAWHSTINDAGRRAVGIASLIPYRGAVGDIVADAACDCLLEVEEIHERGCHLNARVLHVCADHMDRRRRPLRAVGERYGYDGGNVVSMGVTVRDA